MADEPDKLIFFNSRPAVIIAGVTFFTRVPIQYSDTPLMEIIRHLATFRGDAYTTHIPIYYSDGTKLAVCKGTRIFPTDDGKKVGVELRYFPDVTVCEIKGQPVFEIRRKGAAAISTVAELFTHDGSFVKWNDNALSGLFLNNPASPFQGIQVLPEGQGLQIGYPGGGTVRMLGGSIQADIGIMVGEPKRPYTGVGIQLARPGQTQPACPTGVWIATPPDSPSNPST
jgi:hypothetical protein